MPARTRRLLIGSAVLLLVVLVGGRLAAGVYTESLWFDGLGYAGVYWRRILTVTAVRVAAALLGGAVVFASLWWVLRRMGPIHVRRRYGNIEIAEKIPRRLVMGGAAVVSLLAGWWLSEVAFDGRAALDVLFWMNRTAWGVSEPVYGNDVGFYVFTLPVLVHLLNYLLLLTFWTALLTAIGYVVVGSIRWEANRLTVLETPLVHLASLLAVLVVLVGSAVWLSRYGLLFEGSGVGRALGYADLTARVPGYMAVLLLSFVAAAAVVQGARRRSWLWPGLGMGALVLGGLLFTQGIPALVQKFRVEPNELATEARFIQWNMEATRRAYGLDELRREGIDYRGAAGARPGDAAVDVLPRWDLEPLHATFNQIQTFRRFYSFVRPDFDRYSTADGDRQVVVAVREFAAEGLPEGARTWQTLRLNPQFARGWGVVVTPAAETDVTGGPIFWLGNVDVERNSAAPPSLQLTNPSIFFGETMEHYVVLQPGAAGGPSGAEEASTVLTGEAGVDFPEGVRLSSMARLLAFAWRFGDENLLFSGEVDENSRFVYRRLVRERVQSIAPFLMWDADAHPVIHAGRLVWLIDGYSSSSGYPLARALSVQDAGAIRYLRPSVKATVDAVTGDVALYVVRDDEPMVRTYARAFPGLFRSINEMPDLLRQHLRYPTVMLSAQARILTEYHLLSAEAFYAGRDVWEVARSLGSDGRLQPYQPMHLLAPLPGASEPEFLLMLPFVARERQNMTSLVIARNDPPNYGELVLLELPRDVAVPGPSQVQALIEQDAAISQDLSLWRQAGSDVDLGRIRIVPTRSGILYVEPLFLSAQETAIPELRRVIVSDGRDVAMGGTLEEGLIALQTGTDVVPRAEVPVRRQPTAVVEVRPESALELLQRAEARLRSGDWSGFGARLDTLRELLAEWAGEAEN